jgi:hypothetical protein
MNEDDYIDNIVVKHMTTVSDKRRYGNYLDTDEYEKYRQALKRCYNRRKGRYSIHSSEFSDCAALIETNRTQY